MWRNSHSNSNCLLDVLLCILFFGLLSRCVGKFSKIFENLFVVWVFRLPYNCYDWSATLVDRARVLFTLKPTVDSRHSLSSFWLEQIWYMGTLVRIKWHYLITLIKFLIPFSLRIFLNWSLFSRLPVLDPSLLSPYSDHVLPYLSKIQTVFFNIQHHTFGINSLILSVNLINILGLSPSHYPTQYTQQIHSPHSTLSSPPFRSFSFSL